MVFDAQQWSIRARLFPWTIGIPAVGLALLQVVFATRNMLAPAAPEAEQAPSPAELPPLPAVEQKDEDAAVVAAAGGGAFGAGSGAPAEGAIPTAVARRCTTGMLVWILAF